MKTAYKIAAGIAGASMLIALTVVAPIWTFIRMEEAAKDRQHIYQLPS